MFIEVEGLQVRYSDRGSGDSVILLLHGFGGDLDNWMFNLGALSEKHRLLALDLPGHGKSSKTIIDPSINGMEKFVSKFLELLDLTSVNIVGHSMGGAIAIQMLLDHPQTLKSLTLIGSAGLGTNINSDYLNGFVESQTPQEMTRVLQQLFADKSLVSHQLVEEILNYKRMDGVETALKALSETLKSLGQQTILADNLVASGKPVLLIWGREDQIIPVSHAENFSAAAGTNVEIEIFESAGHMVHMEKAYEVNRCLLDFLIRPEQLIYFENEGKRL